MFSIFMVCKYNFFNVKQAAFDNLYVHCTKLFLYLLCTCAELWSYCKYYIMQIAMVLVCTIN